MAREDGSSFGAPNAQKKPPFFHIASNVRQPDTGWLRSFLGTGDRQHLRAKEGTDCGPDDLLACVRMKCDVRGRATSPTSTGGCAPPSSSTTMACWWRTPAPVQHVAARLLLGRAWS